MLYWQRKCNSLLYPHTNMERLRRHDKDRNSCMLMRVIHITESLIHCFILNMDKKHLVHHAIWCTIFVSCREKFNGRSHNFYSKCRGVGMKRDLGDRSPQRPNKTMENVPTRLPHPPKSPQMVNILYKIFWEL